MNIKEFKVYLSNNNCFQSVFGLISDNFGIWKNDHQYTVIQLTTGYRVVTFPYLRQARTFVTQTEKIPLEVPDLNSITLKNAIIFSAILGEIINQIQKDEKN